MTSKELGTIGENLATKILVNKNYKILDRNFKSSSGEIDIICYKENIISFIEVKSLSIFKNNFIYEPKEQITRKKRLRILSTANYFIIKNGLKNLNFKFDLMEIKFWGNKKYSYNYIENIF